MKAITLLVGVFVLCLNLFAQEFVLSGNQESAIRYKLEQNITPFSGIDVMMVSFVVPRDFASPTYTQKISDLKFEFNPPPREKEEETDARGNQIRKFYWDRPDQSIQCVVKLKADNRVALSSLKSNAAFPPSALPAEAEVYVKSTNQVQSDNPDIKKKGQELTAGLSTQFAAVQSILHFVVDHLHYVLVPENYDAVYALHAGKGNCQNYSHLATALMRSVGIPVRIVNGITLKKSYDVRLGQSEYSFEMAQGRHSWIEVFFPDLGWVPFDPQQTEFFVSNRYLRIETGLDNEETVQDGLVRWTQSHGSEKAMPKLEEAIESNFLTDNVSFLSKKQVAGPEKLLLTPELFAAVPPLAVEEPSKVPEEKPEKKPVTKTEPKPKPEAEPEPAPEPEKGAQPAVDYTTLNYNTPFEYGNLEYPINFDFLYARLAGQEGASQKNELKRNFMVETAEYVTGREQFAQTFVLDEPIKLSKVGIALHNFGGNGFLWLELSEDADGAPGETAASSRKLPVNYIRIPKGYDWVDFDFSSQGLILSPGRYWFVLHYSGSPIVNWFYSYGKAVGPVDGTRSRTVGENEWDRILSYEFNYRVVGKAAK